jgi:hypothetical protein
MKKITLLILSLACCAVAYSQNQPPVVFINQTSVDTATKTITINFDAIDIQNDPIDIYVFLSADSGKTFLSPVQSVQGDAGINIPSGSNKSMQISYNSDSLMMAAQGNPASWFMVKIVATDNKPLNLPAILGFVDSAMVVEHMQFLSVQRNHSAHQGALNTIRDSIATRFNRFGLQTQTSSFNFGTFGGQNIWGRHPGLLDERKTIIVDGHYDAVANSPGADDNASAVAATLISAQILSLFNFEKTIKFIAFDKEENGLLGSGHYVSNSIPPFEDIEVVLNMEMIGYYDDAPNTQQIPTGFSQLFPVAVDSITASGNQGKWLFVVGNTNSSAYSAAYDSIARAHIPHVNTLRLDVPGNGQIAPDLRRSDHAKFWDAGYKALMLTDGADFRNANYHTPGDSVGTLNIDFLIRNIQATLMVAATLAKPISASHALAGSWQLLNGLTSVNAIYRNDNWELFPVPAQHQLFVRINLPAGNYQLKITDPQGKVVQTQNIQVVQANQTLQLNLNHLESGLYFAELSNDENRLVKKMIVSESHKH